MEFKENIVGILDNIFGDHRKHYPHKYQISYDCPVCSYDIKQLGKGDGKGNLEINYQNFLYNCWVCSETHGTKGSLLKLIKKYGTDSQYKRLMLFIPDDVLIEAKKHNPIKLPKEFISFNNVSEGMKKTHHFKQAFNYIKKRNITDDLIAKNNIGFCIEGRYANRIVIPSFDDMGYLNYFACRSYESKPYLKYLNPEQPKEEVIWNEYNIDWDKPIYIVEGPFDSIFLPNSIALLGKKISDKLFNLLYKKANEIIIILDGDAYENAVKLYEKLNGGRLLDKVSIIKLPKEKDIADLEGNISNYELIKLY